MTLPSYDGEQKYCQSLPGLTILVESQPLDLMRNSNLQGIESQVRYLLM